jgi:hypothetical protein
MSNDVPPRACLANFGFTNMVLDHDQQIACNVQLEAQAMVFMFPELLMPSAFGLRDCIPSKEADIYAFALVIFQV